MNVLIEITRDEMEDVDMSDEYQVESFIESVISNTLTFTDSEVDVDVSVSISEL